MPPAGMVISILLVMFIYKRERETFLAHVPTWFPMNITILAWWPNDLETFSVLRALCEGILQVAGGSPHKGPVTRSFDVLFDIGLNKLLNKQSNGRWFELP